MEIQRRPGLPRWVLIVLIIATLNTLFAVPQAAGEAWRENPEWYGREKTLRSGLRAGEAVQYLEHNNFFIRHMLIECFEGRDGFAVSVGWSEISINGAEPVLFSVDGREPELLPEMKYSADHFVQMPADHERSISVVAAFIRGLEVAFWTRDWNRREFEHPYSLYGLTKALDIACGWHPALSEAKIAARKIRY